MYWLLFKTWASIGLQSFGGGTATLYLMRRETVERRQWLTDEEFSRYWAICQVAPGINILGQTVLIGWRVAGAIGIVLSLIGLLMPSVIVTTLIAASYTGVRDQPLVQNALHGILPATVGMGLLLIYQMIRPPLVASRREGRFSLGLSIALVLLSAVLAGMGTISIVLVLWGVGGIAALASWLISRRKREAPPGDEG